MNAKFEVVPFLFGLVGAAAGGVAGYFGFDFMWNHGFYAMILPGVAIGLGFSLASRRSSVVYGIVCAVLALGLSIYIESQYFIYEVAGSFTYLLSHPLEIQPVSLIMIALGTVLAFVIGRGRPTYPRSAPR